MEGKRRATLPAIGRAAPFSAKLSKVGRCSRSTVVNVKLFSFLDAAGMSATDHRADIPCCLRGIIRKRGRGLLPNFVSLQCSL